ncbi:MAG TPA: 16S rRNA (cytosine(1402)-N(4))-methyltransferase RsmH [Terriglobales bacterium]|nr:16S rRNA (cytosine(1402)-N(4))-methyltransferase RsmH [Terriglobales bacterium]
MGEGFTDTPQGVGRGGKHVPVLLKEAIDLLAVRRGGTYIDATVGLGGHSYEIARRLGAQGHLIGLDKDPAALEMARQRLEPGQARFGPVAASGSPRAGEKDWPKITLFHASFTEIEDRLGAALADGLLADLGASSLQFGDPLRGFSFQAEGPLDMRMNPQAELTAEQVVNHLDERKLADVIYEFGEERRSRRIARAIVRSRPIHTTAQLADVISAAARPMKRRPLTGQAGPCRGRGFERIHPATRTFQALRIFVNRELDDLRALLERAPQILVPGGRLVIIGFHSLEDRIVKDALREGIQRGYYRALTKKPVTPGEEEIDRNPRSRSAKLRAAERT